MTSFYHLFVLAKFIYMFCSLSCPDHAFHTCLQARYCWDKQRWRDTGGISCALSSSRSFSKQQQPKGEGEKMDRGGGEDQDEVLLWCRSVFPHLNLPALGFGEYPRWGESALNLLIEVFWWFLVLEICGFVGGSPFGGRSRGLLPWNSSSAPVCVVWMTQTIFFLKKLIIRKL